ncbi:hypothetical protein FOMPIDRAFT_1050082 [Fomitopsis schrenkii]|uniref:Uncharacterized protein n=1 Tax=Fomitopsis schrenkii TaxID=2126942 RepID=S8FNV8_FOMSC|nr:hypothetical protein FOMPIDRAFT_1050082 [Fomitopsis schrenkii]
MEFNAATRGFSVVPGSAEAERSGYHSRRRHNKGDIATFGNLEKSGPSGGGLEASDQQLEWNEICSILECLVFTKEEVEENRPVAPRDVIMRLSELYRTSARAPARGSEGTKQPYSSNTKSAAQITAERHEEIEQPGITRPVLTNMLTARISSLPIFSKLETRINNLDGSVARLECKIQHHHDDSVARHSTVGRKLDAVVEEILKVQTTLTEARQVSSELKSYVSDLKVQMLPVPTSVAETQLVKPHLRVLQERFEDWFRDLSSIKLDSHHILQHVTDHMHRQYEISAQTSCFV